MRPVVLALAAAVGASIAAPPSADAYEYEVVARTIGQAYQLRSFRLVGGDVVLSRRRFTQSLALEIRDLGDLSRKLTDGPTISFSSYMRIDHDFGDWTMGELDRDGVPIDAIDAIPELTQSSLALDLLYAYVAVDNVAGGLLDLRAGRQIRFERFDAWAWDGASARVHTPWRAAIEVAGGLRIRDASPFGPASYELDGTQGADCQEYVEAATPGAGSWQIIDRSRVPVESPFTADLDYCPQRRAWMPAVAVAVETEHVRGWHARLAYRRSMSKTVGVIGEVDRLDFPDVGLYPNESGQAPAWGVNEEQLVATGEATLGRVTPYAGARWSFLHGAFADVVAGARVQLGDHAIEPEVSYTRPIFDGDSIFNVFLAYPSLDGRVGWVRRHGGMRARAEAWLRRYDLGEDEEYAGSVAHAFGGRAVLERRLGTLALGVDAIADGGWGGRRAGGTVRGQWARSRYVTYGARAALLHLVEEDRRRVLGSATLGGAWYIVHGVGFRGVVEGTSSRAVPAELRVLGILDLAFVPEI